MQIIEKNYKFISRNGDGDNFSFRFPRGKRSLDAANESELHLWSAKEFRSRKASEILFRPNMLAQFRFRSRFLHLEAQINAW